MKVCVATASEAETRALGERIGALLRPGDVVVLDGALGMGKTAFAKGVARALGVTDAVVSPSFAMVREYEGRLRMLHVDVYRLDRFQEVHDLGLDDELGEQAVTVIEWGGRVGALLPPERLVVALEPGDGDDERRITIEAVGPTWAGRLDGLTAAIGSR